jgi:hypothetical protein
MPTRTYTRAFPPPAGRDLAITLDTYSHAVPALEEEAAHTVAVLVFRS